MVTRQSIHAKQTSEPEKTSDSTLIPDSGATFEIKEREASTAHVASLLRKWDIFKRIPTQEELKRGIIEGHLHRFFYFDLPLEMSLSSAVTIRSKSCKALLRTPHKINPQYEAAGTEAKYLAFGKMVRNEALIYELFRRKNLPKTPRLLAFDTTTSNELELPYLLAEYMPGQPLDEVYSTFSWTQKYAFVREFVQWRLLLERVKLGEADVDQSGTWGEVCCSPKLMSCATQLLEKTLPTDWVTWHNFIVNRPLFEIKNFYTPTLSPDDAQPSPEASRVHASLYDLLRRHLHMYINFETRPLETNSESTWTWELLLEILEHMKDRGDFFALTERHPKLVLCHMDLSPHNIRVRYDDDRDTYRLSGIVNWQGLTYVPLTLARKPDTWLWDWDGKGYAAWVENAFKTKTETLRKDLLNAFDGDKIIPGWYESKDATLGVEARKIKYIYNLEWTKAYLGWLHHPVQNRYLWITRYGHGMIVRRLANLILHDHPRLDRSKFQAEYHAFVVDWYQWEEKHPPPRKTKKEWA